MAWFVVERPAGIPRDPFVMIKAVISAPSKAAIPADDKYVSGPYATQAQAEAALNKATGGNPSPVSQINKLKGIGIPNPFSAITNWASGLATVLKDLTERATWIRILKIVLGGAVVIIGVMHLSEVQDLTKTIGKAGAVLAL